MEAPSFAFGDMGAGGWIGLICVAIAMFVMVKSKYKNK